MLLNKKSIYWGATLFSTMILGSLTTETVKADTVSSSAAVSTTAPNQSGTSSTVSDTKPSTPSTTGPATTTSQVSNADPAKTPTPSTTTGSTTASTSGTTSNMGTQTQSTTGGLTITTQPVTSSTKPATTTGTSTTGTDNATTTNAAPTTNPVSTTNPATSTNTQVSDPYAIPSNITNDTVVNFTDPLLGQVVKTNLNINPSANITVGAIKNFKSPTLGVSVPVYDSRLPINAGKNPFSDQDSTPIESLNGMQYLQLLPANTQILFDAKLGTDANANDDLTPLDKLNLNQVVLTGNFSAPNVKKIDVNQLNDLDPTNLSYVGLMGDTSISPTSGLDNKGLATIAPLINKMSTLKGSLFDIGSTSITDFTPLAPSQTGTSNLQVIAVSNLVANPTPVYAVTGQPITFTAPKILGIDGSDLASSYHFSYSTPKASWADGNLTNLGDDKYVLQNPDPTAKVLYYGNLGFMYSSNPDSYVHVTNGNVALRAILMNGQPIIWQAHPTVTVDYVDASGQPILDNGVPMTKTLAGVNIGDPYDLTTDSKVEGYDLTSPATTLTGNYTQAPQTIKLVYSAIIKTPTTPTTPKVPNKGSNSSNPKVPTTPSVPTIPTKKASRLPIEMTDLTAKSVDNAILSSMGVKATTKINGKLFYLVGYGQWVAATDFNAEAPSYKGIVRTFNQTTTLYDSTGQPIARTLIPNGGWKYSKVVAINGQNYYQVATNEFLAVADGLKFTPTTTKTSIQVTDRAVVYDSRGNALTTTLPANSSWITDGCAIINGVKMYRVANDEWIKADNSEAIIKAATTYHTKSTTPLYDTDGHLLARSLAAGTDWKVDQIVEDSSGQQYYRVATDEYIKL